METSRRNFLGLAAVAVPLAMLTERETAAQAAGVCADPATLPLSQKKTRRALGYVEPSTDAVMRCGHCAFFAAASAGCGTCQMLSGGPVSAGGVCTSFTAK